MNYNESIEYLYNQLPFFSKDGASAIKPGLKNITLLCERLGNPQKKIKFVHIGGTNGKGSTSHFLAAILQCSGYKTGLFTSPHLKNFTERIRIDGIEIPENFVSNFITANLSLIEEIKPSFFEVTFAMALHYFDAESIDIAIIEVGLGGRLDSTNIITPILSLITNISDDHKDILGDTLIKIAYEKAGIIKKNVPIIISERQKEVEEVFTLKAKDENAPLYWTDDIEIVERESTDQFYTLDIKINNKLYLESIKCGLYGKYQTKNIKGVIKACQILSTIKFNISSDTLIEGLLKVVDITELKGRWQILNTNPLIICDTGHNEAGIGEIVNQLKETPFEKLFFIIGLTKDKTIDSIISLLPLNAYYFFSQASTARALSSDILAYKAREKGLKGEILSDVNEALDKAKEMASNKDVIFIGGSNFLVAELDLI